MNGARRSRETTPARADPPQGPPPTASGATLRLLLFVCAYAVIIALGIQLGHWALSQLEINIHLSPETDAMWQRVVLSVLLVYIVLMTLPFVPGVEIGIAMLMMFGAELALLVYLGTVLALCLSFVIGRCIPERLIAGALRSIGLRRAQALAATLESRPAGERLDILLEATPARSLRWLLRYRYLMVVLLLNLPGNVIVGGAGGIGLGAGMSRLFGLPGYVLTVALAAAPVPLLVYLSGMRGL